MPDDLNSDLDILTVAQPAADLRSLLALNDVEFVASAYLTLLRRPADVDGLRHYTTRLRAGHAKLEVLALLSSSREGKHRGVCLAGLDEALRRYRLLRIPLIGGLFRVALGGEGDGPRERRLRSIEQSQLRHECIQARLLGEVRALRTELAAGKFGGASVTATHDELVVQPRGQAPSVLSRFIKLERAGADEVIDQLAGLVRASFEAEQLAKR